MPFPAFPIDVIAAFNPCGQVKPLYLRLEADDHSLTTLTVHRILYVREERYGGIRCFRYTCEVSREPGQLITMDLYYHIDTHKWLTEPAGTAPAGKEHRHA